MRRLLQGSTAMLVSFGARAASQWFLVWLFAYYGGTRSVGAYAQALAISTPIFILAEGGLRNIYLSAKSRPSFGAFLRLRIVSLGFATALCLVLSLLIGIDLASIMLPLVIIKIADSVLDLLLVLRQASGEFAAVALGGLVNAGATVMLGWATAAWSNETVFLLWASAAGSVITLGLFVRSHSAMRGAGRSSKREMFRHSMTLGLAIGLNSLFAYLPVLYLSIFGDLHSVGLYAAVAYAITFCNVILTSLQQGILPQVVAAAAAGAGSDEMTGSLRRAAAFMSGAGIVLSGATLMLLPELAPRLYGNEFVVTRTEVAPIAACVLAMSAIYYSSIPLLVMNRYESQLWAAMVALIASTIVALVLHANPSFTSAALIALTGYGARALVGIRLLRQSKYSGDVEVSA